LFNKGRKAKKKELGSEEQSR